MDSRYSFLDQEPPPGYVAGIGRGATGFTTQLDVGGTRLSNFTADNDDEEEEENGGKFEDADDGLLTTKNRDDEDDEADLIYDEIELRMLKRRKRKIDDVEADELKEINLIGEQFQDLKKNLVTVTEDEWLNLPEVRDLTKKNKRQREALQLQQRFYAVPDTVLTNLGNDSDDVTNFKSISSAKDKLLEMELDKLAPSDNVAISTTTRIDDVETTTTTTSFDVENLANTKQARLILANLRKNEPSNVSGWISGARLEESVKRLNAARNLIAEGCQKNPLNESIWLENVRLNNKELAMSIIRQLLIFQPNSVKLWLCAYDLEKDLINRKRLLRKLLENIPTSVELWKSAIELESSEERQKLLLKLVELTNSLDLWLQLIESEKDITKARNFLNDARKLNPNSIEIWIHAARLEERSTENEIKIDKLLSKGIRQIPLPRDEYLKKAVELEIDGFPICCSVIIRHVLDIGMGNLEESAKIKIWLKDAKIAIERGFVESAKSIYQFILTRSPQHVNTWRQFLKFIKQYKSLQELIVSFQEAIELNPTVELFWLWYAKEYMLVDELDKSNGILITALEHLPNNENILFAQIKLSKIRINDVKLQQTAIKEIFNNGINNIGTVRVYYKYINYLRTIGEQDDAIDMVTQGLLKFPDCFKLYLQGAQIYSSKGEIAKAKDFLQQGVLQLPTSIPLWLSLSRLEESVLKKNAILDRAILKNSQEKHNGLLWREKFRLEKLANLKNSQIILSKLMKLIPSSPELWCEYLLNLERKSLQKTAFRDAMALTDDDPLVLNTIGYILWKDGKIARCKNFFDKSIELNPDIGDSWIMLYMFLQRHGDPDEQEKLLKDIEIADPHHGEVWCLIAKRLDMVDATREQILAEGAKVILLQ